MKTFKFTLLSLFGLLVVAACIRIKNDSIISNTQYPFIKFKFDFDPNSTDPAVTASDILTTDVFIFEKTTQRFVDMWTFHRPNLNGENRLGCPLLPGTYEVVVWGNTDPHFFTRPSIADFENSQPLKADARLELELSSFQEDNLSMPLLFYGQVATFVVTPDGKDTVTVPLSLNTYTIKLTVQGLPVSTNVYQFTITDNNGAYDFDNHFAAFKAFSYNTPAQFVGSELKAKLNVLKLTSGRSAKIAVKNLTTHTVVYPATGDQPDNLIDLILTKYPDVDFQRVHGFEVILTFGSDAYVSIDITPWDTNEDLYDILPE
jgi:hypothetical protein